MSVVVNPVGSNSSWQDGAGYDITVSKAELQLLQHIRMLGPGVRAVRLVKESRGMRGLREWRVVEVVTPKSSAGDGEKG